MLNYIHYRTNSKHAFYFNKTNTIKTKKIIKISNSKYNFFIFQNQKKFSTSFYYIGGILFRALYPYICPISFSKIFHISGDFRFRALYPLLRTLVCFGKEHAFLYHTKVSHSTTLKCILIYILNIHTFPTYFQFCKYFPSLPKFSIRFHHKQMFTNKHSFTIFYL